MASVSKREWTHKGEAKSAWIVRWVDHTGKHCQRTFAKKKEADAFRAKTETEKTDRARSGILPDVTVKQAIIAYERYNERRVEDGQIKRSYFDHVNTALRVSVMPFLGKLRLEDVDGLKLTQWFHDIRNEGLSARTACDRVILFSGLWKFARRQKMVGGDNPASEALEHIGTIPKTRIRTFTPAQVSDLLRIADTRRPRQRQDSWLITRIIVNLGTFCGLRIGEIMALRLADIDIPGRRIHVRHTINRWDELTPPKSKDSIRVIPIPDHVTAMLAEWVAKHYLENERQIVLRRERGHSGKWHGRTVDTFNHRAWRPLCVAAGVETKEETDHFHFHALRHFAGSWWLRHGLPIVEVSRLLGHADPGVTLRIYAHEIMEQAERQAALDTISAALIDQGIAQELRNEQKALEFQAC